MGYFYAMKRAARYRTRQGEEILRYLVSLRGSHVTAGNVAGYFEGAGPPIGRTTVYRHLERLVDAGKLRRYTLEGEKSACYQYIEESGECREHFHLKCEKCGTLIHLECNMLNDITGHVRKEHRFEINPLKTIFYGTCRKCSDENAGVRRGIKRRPS
jgi:Fur family ferric uptake transcriptional regulator